MRKSVTDRILFGIGISMMIFGSFGMLILDVIIDLNGLAAGVLGFTCFFGGVAVGEQSSFFNSSKREPKAI